jgi:hypothetical protein
MLTDLTPSVESFHVFDGNGVNIYSTDFGVFAMFNISTNDIGEIQYWDIYISSRLATYLWDINTFGITNASLDRSRRDNTIFTNIDATGSNEGLAGLWVGNDGQLVTPSAVPEPESLALFGVALACCAATRRRKAD